MDPERLKKYARIAAVTGEVAIVAAFTGAMTPVVLSSLEVKQLSEEIVNGPQLVADDQGIRIYGSCFGLSRDLNYVHGIKDRIQQGTSLGLDSSAYMSQDLMDSQTRYGGLGVDRTDWKNMIPGWQVVYARSYQQIDPPGESPEDKVLTETRGSFFCYSTFRREVLERFARFKDTLLG